MISNLNEELKYKDELQAQLNEQKVQETLEIKPSHENENV